MAITKADAINQLKGPNSISNQEALVKKIQGTKITKPVKRIIPGGKTLTEDIPEAMLPTAVYNWLRATRHFTEATISLAADPQARKLNKARVVDFDTNTKNSEWELRGKRWLAERIAEILSQDNIVAVQIERAGITAMYDQEKTFSPESDDWEPYIELIPFRPPTF